MWTKWCLSGFLVLYAKSLKGSLPEGAPDESRVKELFERSHSFRHAFACHLPPEGGLGLDLRLKKSLSTPYKLPRAVETSYQNLSHKKLLVYLRRGSAVLFTKNSRKIFFVGKAAHKGDRLDRIIACRKKVDCGIEPYLHKMLLRRGVKPLGKPSSHRCRAGVKLAAELSYIKIRIRIILVHIFDHFREDVCACGRRFAVFY